MTRPIPLNDENAPEAVREVADAKLEALRVYTQDVVERRGHPSEPAAAAVKG
jgi:hypothetical protein